MIRDGGGSTRDLDWNTFFRGFEDDKDKLHFKFPPIFKKINPCNVQALGSAAYYLKTGMFCSHYCLVRGALFRNDSWVFIF